MTKFIINGKDLSVGDKFTFPYTVDGFAYMTMTVTKIYREEDKFDAVRPYILFDKLLNIWSVGIEMMPSLSLKAEYMFLERG